MALSIGIVGLPNVGKSTLFNALTQSAQAEARNFPFTTIEPNVGIVPVPDERLDLLAQIEKSQNIVPATVKFIDIAGIISGAHKGEGLGNKFLSHIREVSALCLVTRAFENSDTIHVAGDINPKNDIETIFSELQLADLQTIAGIKTRMESTAKSPGKEGKEAQQVLQLIARVEGALNQGKLASTIEVDIQEKELLKNHLPLLTSKPLMVVFNVNEEDAGENVEDFKVTQSLQDILNEIPSIIISARVEAEVVTLNEDDRNEYLSEIGLKETGLRKLIREAYSLLGLITFFTAGPQESRAWTIVAGENALTSAGKIHNDFQQKFIRAEVIAFDDFIKCEGWQKASASGKMRLEGKDYIVKDGDVLYFRHGQ